MNFIRGTVMVIVLMLQPIFLLYKLLFGRRTLDGSSQQLTAIETVTVPPSAHDLADRKSDVSNSNNVSQQLDATTSASSPSAPVPVAASESGDGGSNSLPLPVAEYEVFLSFRGPDTRHQFTDILYRFLVHLKVRTFRDDDELRKGEGIWSNLVKSIGQSKVHVPVLSESYAHSKWCLKELAEIAKCRKQEKGHMVLPIFYMMDPREVRHQTGPYESAFQQHEKNFDAKTVQEWRDALNEIGALKGWHVRSKDEQGAIADCVSDVVWSHLSRNDNLLDINELVGIDDSIKSIVEKLSLDSEGVIMVGLHGLGGIGKSTIARAVYHKISARFERRSFLENIREMQEQKDGVISLQKKLTSSIMRMDSVGSISNVNEGRSIMQDRVSQFKVLIILDDVDENFKFEDILGNPGNFASGSRFIITSRNIKLLSTFNDNNCMLYEVREMSPQLSLQLFCKHAFKTDSPPQDFTTLSEKIVATTGGLPLTLKVVGSLLFREDKSIWEDKLSQLEKNPEQEVKERLKISYDGLQYESKQIFLDVACFFIGMKKKIPSYFWSDCNFHPVSSINILLQRSMLKIRDDDTFQMHDQMRDMGRTIVREENIEEPEMRSRIWDDMEGLKLLFHNKGSKHIKALRAWFPWVFLGGLNREHFSNLSELRYFEAEYAKFDGDFNNVIPNLRWLRLHDHYNDELSPTNFHMRNLVILDLHGSTFLKADWGGWSQIKMANKLKVLDISYCIYLKKLPEFPKSGSIEVLNLSDVGNTASHSGIELDIGSLWNLKELILRDCKLKRVIGGTIGRLECLEELDLTNLKSKSLKEVVADIGESPSLKVLKSIGAQCIPSYMLSSSDEDEEEGGVEEEEEEEEVNGQESSLDKEGEGLERLPPSLKVLHTSSRVVNLSELLELEELVVEDCDFGLEIPPTRGYNNDNENRDDEINTTSTTRWWKSSKLKSLTLRKTSFVVKQTNSSNTITAASPSSQQQQQRQLLMLLPSSLATLHISNCENLEWLPTLENLTELTIENCSELREVRGIEGLRSLQALVIDGARNLTHLHGLDDLLRLKDLRTFDIDNCPHLLPRSPPALLLQRDDDFDLFS